MSFEVPPFRFTLDDGFACLDLGEALCEISVEDLQEQLQDTGRLPDLAGAPLASWLLARLQFLSADAPLVPSDAVEDIEDGVWVVDFVVGQGGLPIAKVQLQAGMAGAGLLGVAGNSEQAGLLVQSLIQRLLEAPSAVAECQIRIHDPLWRVDPGAYAPHPGDDAVVHYGFDGEVYLGKDNIRANPGSH